MIYILWCTYMLICWQVITCTDKLETQKMLTDDWGRYVMLCHLTHNISPLNSPWITLESPANHPQINFSWYAGYWTNVGMYMCMCVLVCMDVYGTGIVKELLGWPLCLTKSCLTTPTQPTIRPGPSIGPPDSLYVCLVSLFIYILHLSLSLSLSLSNIHAHTYTYPHMYHLISLSLSLSLSVCA